MDEDVEPFILAVVEVAGERAGDQPSADATGVAMEAAAMLGGADMGAGLAAEPAAAADAKPNAEAVAKAAGLANIKNYFTRAGFEVSAPVGTTFSIGARQSGFEEFFGEQLSVDMGTLGYTVKTAAGAEELPIDPLPNDIRSQVTRIFFMPPPELDLPPLG